MTKRKSQRHTVMVDIEIARTGLGRVRGYARNISREGVSVHLLEGQVPAGLKSVLLCFKIWTGRESLYRKLHARIVRVDGECVGLEFAEQDLVAHAVVQDLLYYRSFERRGKPRLSTGDVQQPLMQDRRAAGRS